MFGFWLIRRRWVLAVIFGCSLIYFITSIYKQSQVLTKEQREEVKPPKPEQFDWEVKWEQANASRVKNCRNSVQGQILITDEKGYLCSRENLQTGGCCDTDAPSTRRYVCEACRDNGCCSVYEHCVSCCMEPEKQQLLRKILGKASETFPQLFASVTDHFELCLAKCRTSSESVQHENSYRDPKARYCFGDSPPNLQLAAI